VGAVAATTVSTVTTGVAAGAAIAGTLAVANLAVSDIQRGEVSNIDNYMLTGAREAFVGAVIGAIFAPFSACIQPAKLMIGEILTTPQLIGTLVRTMVLGGTANSSYYLLDEVIQGRIGNTKGMLEAYRDGAIFAGALHSVSPAISRAFNKLTQPKIVEPTKVVGETKFTYKNNPMDNPKAVKDIMENPEAVYGYSPKPESNLSKFNVDWTNAEQVADAQAQRIKYHEGLKIEKAKINQDVENLLKEGSSMEDIARMKVNERNAHRIETYIKDGNLEGLESMKARNMRQYQNPDGPTPEQLFKKYGSWEEVINSSVRSNPGMDACTGLYDIYGGN
jgi:hypothetical protein